MRTKKRTSTVPTPTTSSSVKNKKKGKIQRVQSQAAGPSQDEMPTPTLPRETPFDKIKCFYPRENLNLEVVTEGTVKAVERAVAGVLSDCNIRFNVPRNIIAAISEEVPELDEEVLIEELLKYGLITSSRFDKLYTGTLLSIVQDLCRMKKSLVDYENGCPAKLASSVFKFYNLTAQRFMKKDDEIRGSMTKRYIQEGIKYQKEMETFLEEKYASLMEKENICDGVELDEIFQKFRTNQKVGKQMKNGYEDIMDEELAVGLLGDHVRSLIPKPNVGMGDIEETYIMSLLKLNPIQSIKLAFGRNGNETDRNLSLPLCDIPIQKTKANSVEYEHEPIPISNVPY